MARRVAGVVSWAIARGFCPRRTSRTLPVLLIAACLCAAGCASGPPKEETGISAAIRRRELSAHVHYLAHPSLEGRAPKSRGGRKALRYVTERFAACGLQPWPGSDSLQMPFGSRTNIVGLLPGSDSELGKEMVLVVAHRDHLGRIGRDVFPGAVDNASGTAALIELAEHFAAQQPRPARTLCFFSSDGEEEGLLGALAFACERLTEPSRLAAVVNIDGLGRKCFESLPDTMLVFGTEGFPHVRAATRQAARSQRLRALPLGTDLLGARADHVVFTPLGVPSLTFTCGMYSDYHGTDDTANKIQYGKMLREVEVVKRVVRGLADSSARPRPVQPELGDVEELAAVAQLLRVVRRNAWLLGMPSRQRRAMDAAAAQARRLLARPEQYTLRDRWEFHERMADALPEFVARPDLSVQSLVPLYLHAMRHILKHYPQGADRIPALTAYTYEIPPPLTRVRAGADGRLDVDTTVLWTGISLWPQKGRTGIAVYSRVHKFQVQGPRREVIDQFLAKWPRARDDIRGGACWDWLMEQITGENPADDYEGWLAWRDREFR